MSNVSLRKFDFRNPKENEILFLDELLKKHEMDAAIDAGSDITAKYGLLMSMITAPANTRKMVKIARTDNDMKDFMRAVSEQNNVFIFIDEADPEIQDVKLPKRSTSGSAGYDFFSNETVTLKPGESHIFKTGVSVFISNHMVLKIYPRSGLGFKYKCQLANTVGIIDADYVFSDNNGHIMIKITNDGDQEFTINKGDAFVQGICTMYFTTIDDEVEAIRNGGMGSTDEKREGDTE